MLHYCGGLEYHTVSTPPVTVGSLPTLKIEHSLSAVEQLNQLLHLCFTGFHKARFSVRFYLCSTRLILYNWLKIIVSIHICMLMIRKYTVSVDPALLRSYSSACLPVLMKLRSGCAPTDSS